MSRTRRRIRPFLLLALSLAIFLPFIGLRDIITSHEARVVQVARQMAASGWPWNAQRIDVPQVEIVHLPEGERLRGKPDGSTMSVNPWLVPVLNGEIRLQKPPLPYWCTAILFRAFGFGEGIARLTPALMGALSVLMIWDLARLLLGRVGAWYAAIVWISSYFIVDEFRKSMADPYLAFFTLGSLWAWVHAGRSARSRGWLIGFYALLAMGMLAKGPIILLFAAILIATYQVCYRKSMPGRWHWHVLGSALFLAIALPWYATIWIKIDRALELWRYESVGSFNDNAEKARAWWFYLPNLLQISLPWTPLWLMGIVLPLMHPRRRRFFPLIACALIVTVFSFAFEKKNAYLLPMMPLAVLIVAQGLLWMTATFRSKPRHLPVRAAISRVTIVGVILAAGVQVFLSGFLAAQENRRSAKEACGLVMRLMSESPARSLLVSHLPEEASVYLPLGLRDSRASSEVLLIIDNHRGDAEMQAQQVQETPAGAVTGMTPLAIPHARSDRWRIFSLKIALPEKTAS